jgi:outer membrane protein OmpA-like peptidoglycan-associated protein
MFEQEDEGTRIGLWVLIGILFLVLMGVIGGVVLRHMHGKQPATAPQAAAAAVVVVEEIVLIEGPIAGELAATLYFEVAQSVLPADAAMAFGKVIEALNAAPARKVVLSGFHDASGDAEKNAELAKQRALSARDALKAAGVDSSRIGLRKPEVTTGTGSEQEARRVELRIVE